MATRVLARTDVRGVEGDLRTALARPRPEADDVAAVVREILAIVRAGGDNALRDLTERFDRFRPDEFAVSRAEREAALARVDPE
ncbi:MAG: histidinol dehydrogenase, partial [Acidimicrobiia bacterium]